VLCNPEVLFEHRRQEFMREAELERLLAQLPRSSRRDGLRPRLARACHRLADWLDSSNGYLSPRESGPTYFAARTVRL
jgi:hypothetical protein